MAIKKILPENFELFTLQTNPFRYYISSSLDGISGKINLFSRRSPRVKDPQPLSFYSGSYFQDQDLMRLLHLARSGSNNTSAISQYMSGVNHQQTTLKHNQQLDILRFKPGFNLDKNFMTKGIVTNNLMSYYRTSFPSANFSFGNYNTLNFFSTQDNSIPSTSVLLYPNPITTNSTTGLVTGPYIPNDAFTFDFWLNPRYTNETDVESIKTGTLFHLSSCFAVSLVSGSSKDVNGLVDGFRLLLQLSSSTDLPPSSLSLGSLPLLSFASEDNSLRKNTWNHVSIRWGSETYNLGSGSFIINGKQQGTFNIPSASIIPRSSSFSGKDGPCVLCVGNYYEGKNSLTESMSYFFTSDTATREGLTQLIADNGDIPQGMFKFDHPLKAEIHDLKIYNRYLNDLEILKLSTDGPANVDGLIFYLPPFFTKEAPSRQYYLGSGGVLVTPFFTQDGTTTTPFSSELSFGLGGHYMNLENYTREFISGNYPRLFGLTASVISQDSTLPLTLNEILYATGSVRKRNLTILPSDNGLFCPNFSTFLNPLDSDVYKNDLGNYEPGSVSLRNLISTSSVFSGLVTGSLLEHLAGASPDSLISNPGETYAILQRTRDNSSNQVVFFDISNMFYGDNIKPGTLIIHDNALSGSGNKVRITLKDDGSGNIYRADTTGSHATWNSVGNIFYNEGIIIIKHPSLFFFGENQFSVQFSGERNIHVQKFNIVAQPYEHVSSSNPEYIPVSASNSANDYDKQFVYVTGINLHDDNLNVISRTNLAQPIVLRTGDQMKFVVKMDY